MNRLSHRLLAEGLGTALLLAIVIGSSVMAERLAGGNVAIALLGNTLATVWGLYFLIHTFGPSSGAHFIHASLGRSRAGHPNVVEASGTESQASGLPVQTLKAR